MVHSHIFMENIPDRPSRDDLRRRSRVDFNHVHEVIFMIHPKDIGELTRKLYDVSDPESENYGQHLTRSEVVTMISNPRGRDAVVKYLRLNGAAVVSQTLDGDFISASATIDIWERIFDTEFFTFHQTQLNRKVKEVIRAESYSIPRELKAHVKHVLRVVDIPFPLRGGLGSQSSSPSSSNMERVAQSSGVRTSSSSRTGTESGSGSGIGKRNTKSLLAISKKTVTPEKIRQYYNMTNYEGNEFSKQAVYASGGQNLSPIDLRLFQDRFSIIQDVIPVRGNTDHTVCTIESALCAESNLDIQYIMGVSPVSPTIHWYFPGDFADWLVEVSNTTDLPLVLSISYGSQEYRVTQAEHDAFDYQAIKLGVLGVTIFVAAGDDGANGSEIKYLGESSCSYQPEWPCSSPYVIAVGATSGVEMDVLTAETVAQSDRNSVITSGGGFSNHHLRPEWQSKAVAGYHTAAATAGLSPVPGYNVTGRGYPDISVAGVRYATYIGESLWQISGTSASTPVFAAMISNINAARIQKGKGPVGFLNPAIYKHASKFMNDVTVGNNKCVAGGSVCCKTGFHAAQGWDPTTGLGTPNYGKMHDLLVALGGEVNGAQYAPSAAPTVLLKDQPSSEPTVKPSAPTPTPTALPSGPSFSPSFFPSRAPSVSHTPTHKPTRRPTVEPTISICPTVVPSARIFMTGASETVVVISVVSALGCIAVVGLIVATLLLLKRSTRRKSAPAVYMGSNFVFPSSAYLTHLDSIPQILPAANNTVDPSNPRFSLHRPSPSIPLNT